MKRYTLIIIAACVTLMFSGCRKEDTPSSQNSCIGGTGGSLDLAIIPQHHGAPIYGATVYIEFNTLSSPGALSNFDLVMVGEEEENHIHVENMKCGDYFIHCVGYDSTISQVVTGGIPYSIAFDAHGDIDIHVPVTE